MAEAGERHGDAWLRLLFDLAARSGRLAHRLGMTAPTAQEVGAVFADLSPARRLELARALAARRIANWLLRHAIQRLGVEAFARSVRCEGEERLLELARRGHPVVLVPWHCGPLHAIAPMLVKLDLQALVMPLRRRRQTVPGIEYAHAEGDQNTRVRALKRATEQLRKGGTVVILTGVPTPPFDPGAGPFRLFGRAVHLLTGPAVLARLGGAQVIPVAPRWVGQRVVMSFGAPVARPATLPGRAAQESFDRELLSALAAWWEQYFREHPEELWIMSLRAIARAPHAAAS